MRSAGDSSEGTEQPAWAHTPISPSSFSHLCKQQSPVYRCKPCFPYRQLMEKYKGLTSEQSLTRWNRTLCIHGSCTNPAPPMTVAEPIFGLRGYDKWNPLSLSPSPLWLPHSLHLPASTRHPPLFHLWLLRFVRREMLILGVLIKQCRPSLSLSAYSLFFPKHCSNCCKQREKINY